MCLSTAFSEGSLFSTSSWRGLAFKPNDEAVGKPQVIRVQTRWLLTGNISSRPYVPPHRAAQNEEACFPQNESFTGGREWRVREESYSLFVP